MMNNYAKTKKELDRIRSEYGCQGEVIFRSALQCVLDYGMSDMADDYCYTHRVDEINERHDEAEASGKILFITRDFELAILECAREISKVNSYDLLVYIQREVWLSNESMDYKRAVELLKNSLEYIENYNNCNNRENYEAFQNIGLDDDEIEAFGFGYLIEEEE